MKPLGHYTSLDPLAGTPAPLYFLDQKFGSYLQRMGESEKMALLAIITRTLAFDVQFGSDELYTLEDAWGETGYDLSPELGGMLGSLNMLDDGDLLGLCQCLIANHNHAEVAA